MLLKKIVLSGIACALISLPYVAHANLHTYNYYKLDSTVKIKTNGGICAGLLPPFYKFTPASKDGKTPGESDANQFEINAICGHFPCEAEIFMNRNCTGTPVALARLSKSPDGKQVIEIVSTIEDPAYKDKITTDKQSTVTLGQPAMK